MPCRTNQNASSQIIIYVHQRGFRIKIHANPRSGQVDIHGYQEYLREG